MSHLVTVCVKKVYHEAHEDQEVEEQDVKDGGKKRRRSNRSPTTPAPVFEHSS
jgi:hypothetical protein